jgi:arginase
MRRIAARNVHLIGVPLDLGGNRRGVDMGPSAVRIAGLGDKLATLGILVSDKGDVTAPIRETRIERPSHKRYIREIAHVCQRVYRQVYASHEAGALPVVLGGDHSLAAGSVGASAAFARHRQKPLGLIWIDAHADMNTPATTKTGNVHGMPLAALLGKEPKELSAIGGFSPKVSPSRTVLLAVRDLDEPEKERIRASNIHVFTTKDIDRDGIATVMKRAIAIAGRGTYGIHVSLDLDACDPSIAPGVGTPVAGGLNYREAHMVMEMIADAGRLIGLDVVEVNPILDTANRTAVLATELVMSALGMRII